MPHDSGNPIQHMVKRRFARRWNNSILIGYPL